MIDRAILLKDAIYLYQHDLDAECDSEDHLYHEDWLQLVEIKDLLQPIYLASVEVQSNGTKHGALYEVLTTMDCITHLEDAKQRLTNSPASQFKAVVNLG